MRYADRDQRAFQLMSLHVRFYLTFFLLSNREWEILFFKEERVESTWEQLRVFLGAMQRLCWSRCLGGVLHHGLGEAQADLRAVLTALSGFSSAALQTSVVLTASVRPRGLI